MSRATTMRYLNPALFGFSHSHDELEDRCQCDHCGESFDYGEREKITGCKGENAECVLCPSCFEQFNIAQKEWTS